MKATRLTKQLNIQAPIIQAGMPWISNAELAATVSNAGGLGVITSNAGLPDDGDEVDNFHSQLRKIKALTTRPYGVCLFLDNPILDALVSITTEQAVPIVITVGGNPDVHTGHLKDAGITVFNVVGSVQQARSAEARGADGVITRAFEAAGSSSSNDLSSFSLIPQVTDAIEIPVIAAGGISDGRGLVAALGLGASAVYVGTRFIATHECIAHPNLKDAIISAVDNSTNIIRLHDESFRLLRNKALISLEDSDEDINPELLVESNQTRTALLDGSTENVLIHCGSGAGLVSTVTSAANVIKTMVQEADATIARIR